MTTPSPLQPNPLGKASLGLGIVSSALVFGIGICALVGLQQGWLPWMATVLYVCGASSAFLGFLGAVLGAVGVFGKDRQRGTAIVGLVLGLVGLCLFFGIVAAVSG